MKKEGWEIKKLGEVCSYFNDGNWIESKDQSESGIRLIQTGNIGNGYYTDKEEKAKFISAETFKQLKCTEIFEGDCLVSRLPDPIGRACVLPHIERRAITAVDCSILRFKEYIISHYFVYYSQSKQYSNFIEKSATGSTRKRISRSNLGNILIPVPPLPIQEQIVAELDTLNDILAKKRRQLAELDTLAQATFYEMFGDPVDNEKGWDMKKLESICIDIVDCPHSTPIKEETPTLYPCIRTSELKNGAISWNSMQYVSKDEYLKRVKRLIPQTGDIVYGREGTYGDAICIPNSNHYFCLGQRTMLFRPNLEIVNSIFLLRFVISNYVYSQAKNKNSGSTVGHVNVSDIKKFDILCPPLSLQNQFAEQIEAIERQKEIINQSIIEVQKLFDYTMDTYFN